MEGGHSKARREVRLINGTSQSFNSVAVKTHSEPSIEQRECVSEKKRKELC